MRRVAVKIAYLGEGFAGSQIQPSVRTVESEVLDKLMLVSKMSSDEIDLKFSSRTDKDVNALGNAISFYTIFNNNVMMLKALNAVSKGVFYRSACDVDDEFNVRYATARSYRYILPLEDGMDLGLAKECADLFLGEHDFARFCRPDNKPTIACVDSIDIYRKDSILIIDFKARFFLWNMIRRMVGAMDSVSKGTRTLDDVRRALNDLEEINFGVARADALTLMDVDYDWLSFEETDRKQFSETITEESFRFSLRKTFFDSL